MVGLVVIVVVIMVIMTEVINSNNIIVIMMKMTIESWLVRSARVESLTTRLMRGSRAPFFDFDDGWKVCNSSLSSTRPLPKLQGIGQWLSLLGSLLGHSISIDQAESFDETHFGIFLADVLPRLRMES